MKCTECNKETDVGCFHGQCPVRTAVLKEPDQEKQEQVSADPVDDDFDMSMFDDEGPTEQEEQVPTGRTVIKLNNGREIILNEQQDEALSMMCAWIKDHNDLFFRLSGYAGTGKTTIVKEVIKFFALNHIYGRGAVAVSAPTHKAKRVIASATGLEAATLQSLLGLAPNTELADFDVNRPEFSASKEPTIKDFKLIVLDEGSMVNKDLWEMLKNNARRFNVKLLVMLDEAQLPPVKEDLSAIITDKDILSFYQLTKVERQAGDNPLMLIYDAIRNNLRSEKDQFHKTDDVRTILRSDLQPDDPRDAQVQIGHKFMTDLMVFGRAVLDEYRGKEFEYDKNHCKVLCWTNARVAWWNKSIRKSLLSDVLNNPSTTPEVREHAEILMPHEILMAMTNSGDLTNSSDYQIISMQFCEKKVWYGEKKDLQAVLKGYRVSMQDIDEGTIMNTFILDPDPENMQVFTKVFNIYLFLAKTKRQWPAYYSFKGENLLIQDVRDTSGGLIAKKDLDYAYAISIHKSQGSTFNQVFIDLGDVNKNKNWIERNKLKYVAFSRPRYLATTLIGGV